MLYTHCCDKLACFYDTIFFITILIKKKYFTQVFEFNFGLKITRSEINSGKLSLFAVFTIVLVHNFTTLQHKYNLRVFCQSLSRIGLLQGYGAF